jgi:hypothetical protein
MYRPYLTITSRERTSNVVSAVLLINQITITIHLMSTHLVNERNCICYHVSIYKLRWVLVNCTVNYIFDKKIYYFKFRLVINICVEFNNNTFDTVACISDYRRVFGLDDWIY